MAEDTSLLITVLMFLGFLGTIIFIPWIIYNERKKLSLKYPRIGCLMSAVLLLCGMYFLWDSSNPSAHIERNTEEAAEPVTAETTETAEKRFSRADFIPIMEAGVAKAFGENNYSVESDGELVTFNIWNAHASAIFNRLYKGIDKSPDDGWTAQVNGVQKAAEDLQGLVAQYCFEEATVVVNAVDYSDHSKLLVSCNSDAVLFNAADSIEEQIEPEAVETEPENPENEEAPTTGGEQEATPEPEATTEPDPEAEAEKKVQREKFDIESEARYIVSKNYTLTSVDSISVNENLGSETDGDYVLLAYLEWEQKNSPELTKKVLKMYSDDFAAQVGKSLPNVSECAVFWTVPYYSSTDTLIKYSYERRDDKMYQSDVMISSLLD